MMKRILFVHPSPDPEQHPDESQPSELVSAGPKGAFQWPPDCAWPFIDRGWDRET